MSLETCILQQNVLEKTQNKFNLKKIKNLNSFGVHVSISSIIYDVQMRITCLMLEFKCKGSKDKKMGL